MENLLKCITLHLQGTGFSIKDKPIRTAVGLRCTGKRTYIFSWLLSLDFSAEETGFLVKIYVTDQLEINSDNFDQTNRFTYSQPPYVPKSKKS